MLFPPVLQNLPNGRNIVYAQDVLSLQIENTPTTVSLPGETVAVFGGSTHFSTFVCHRSAHVAFHRLLEQEEVTKDGYDRQRPQANDSQAQGKDGQYSHDEPEHEARAQEDEACDLLPEKQPSHAVDPDEVEGELYDQGKKARLRSRNNGRKWNDGRQTIALAYPGEWKRHSA